MRKANQKSKGKNQKSKMRAALLRSRQNPSSEAVRPGLIFDFCLLPFDF
jgi:hypothetical protein